MYRPGQGRFAYTFVRRGLSRGELVGESFRYGMICALGTARLPEERQRSIFGGQSTDEYCSREAARLSTLINVGDTVLAVWALAELRHANLKDAIERLRALLRVGRSVPTVEAAWVLSALSEAWEQVEVGRDAQVVCKRLIRCFNRNGDLFPHQTDGGGWGRSHVGCFADQVYPIQALSRYSRVSGDEEALAVANRCAGQICRQQGADGQWWWHYDVRSGSVIEGYPVYSVHQDAMGPMALMDLRDAGGDDHSQSIQRGLSWLVSAPEIGRSLIDDSEGVVWRKVGRNDPVKAVRRIRAVCTAVRPGFLVQSLDRVFRPATIDYECRPYHLGWILHTWLNRSTP